MNTTPSVATVEADVINIVAQALMLKPERITPDSRLFSDLGAESIDVLDIRFRLERHFEITIADGAIIRSLGAALSRAELDAAFTPASIARFILGVFDQPRS